jgi:hypothetical protein
MPRWQRRAKRSTQGEPEEEDEEEVDLTKPKAKGKKKRRQTALVLDEKTGALVRLSARKESRRGNEWKEGDAEV